MEVGSHLLPLRRGADEDREDLMKVDGRKAAHEAAEKHLVQALHELHMARAWLLGHRGAGSVLDGISCADMAAANALAFAREELHSSEEKFTPTVTEMAGLHPTTTRSPNGAE